MLLEWGGGSEFGEGTDPFHLGLDTVFADGGQVFQEALEAVDGPALLGPLVQGLLQCTRRALGQFDVGVKRRQVEERFYAVGEALAGTCQKPG